MEILEDEPGTVSIPQSNSGHYSIYSCQRTPITGDIVRYVVRVPIRPGEYDVIGIQCVVR